MHLLTESRSRLVTAFAAIIAVVLALIAIPVSAPRAMAAPAQGSTVIDFEGADFSPWVANGATVTIVEDSADPSNRVGAVTDRGTDTWRGISSATGAYEEGVEYAFSLRVRLSEAGGLRLIANEPGASNEYLWVGNTTGAAGEWVTVSGAHTFGAGAGAAKMYLEVANTADYEVDDISVIGEDASCLPLEAIDFEGTDFAPWVANGAAVSIVEDSADATNQVGAVTDRGTDTWRGISSGTGVYEVGVAYTFSVRVRLTEDSGLRLIANEPGAANEYSWVGNTTGTAGEWVTVTGTHTFGAGAAAAKTYLEVDTTANYDVDDILVTYVCDEVGEPCEPTLLSLYTIDLEESGLEPWAANGATVDVIEDFADAGNNVVSVTDRGQGGAGDTWRGVASATGLFAEGVFYTVSARVRVSADADVRFIANEPGAANEYTWVGSTSATAGEWITMSGIHAFGAGAADARLYIEVTNLADYEVDDITATYEQPCGVGPVPGTIAINTDFEDGLGGWGPRDSGTGAPTVAVTTADARGGLQSALVSNRTSQGSGIGIDATELLVPGTTYDLTAWVKFAETPVDQIWLTLQSQAGANTTYNTLAQFTGITASGWTEVAASFTVPPSDFAYLYFETRYDGGAIANTSSFMVDDIFVVVPEPPVIQDLTPIKDTVPFPAGVAIDTRETLGAPSELLLKHFNQISAENSMKPEGWYNNAGEFSPNAAQIDSLMNFAQDNDLDVYGHVLVWHAQTPVFFFRDDEGQPLTTSEEDKQILRDRMRTHIFNVAEYLSQWGEYGGDNPITSWDVVNEVVDDSSAYADGLRRSEWYRILGEEFIDLSFIYADEAFNDEYAAADAVRPVTLFINDYNTEQSGKRGRYLALIDRMLSRDVPIDGIGHQFHVSLSLPVSNLEAAIVASKGRGLLQAVTELDVTTGTPESAAKFIDQGYYYRDAFEIFRTHQDDLFSVTIWGLTDPRSWRAANGGPLVFDGALQAKPAYHGIVEGYSSEDPLPPPLRAANSFSGTVAIDSEATTSPVWERLPLLPAGPNAEFQTRWAEDHLTVYVDVVDATATAQDVITIQVGDDVYTLDRNGDGTATGSVSERTGGYTAVARVPLSSATAGSSIDLDVRVTDNTTTAGWNAPGVLGTLTLVEELSYTEIPEANTAPTIDGVRDAVWDSARSVEATKVTSGTPGAESVFHTLWKDNKLYVFAEIADETVDVSGSDPWIQDSIELYVDGGNFKNGSFRYDDMQVRINADNVVSFGTGDEGFQANRVESAATRVDGGYVIEVAISLLEYGGLDTVHGLDFQVNDAAAGSRLGILNWADPTGAGYQTTARWGVGKLTGTMEAEQDPFIPVIAGTAVVGSTLTVSGLPSGTDLAYEWLRNAVPIAGATAATYTLATADTGARMSVRVTSTGAGLVERTETSAETDVVLRTFSRAPAPVISGPLATGKTLTARVPAWSPKATFTYQWLRDGEPIQGATQSTYNVTTSDRGTRLSVRVTGSATNTVSQTVTSAQTRTVVRSFKVKGPKMSRTFWSAR